MQKRTQEYAVELEMIEVPEDEAKMNAEKILTILMRCALRASRQEEFIELEVV